MLDQVERLVAHAQSHGLAMPSKSSWGCLEGFRRAEQDVDRTPGNWLEWWSTASKMSLANAKERRYSRHGLPSVSLSDVVSCDHQQVSIFSFERDAAGGLGKSLASHLIEARSLGRQGWIRLPASSFPLPAALEGSLKLGAAWKCEPPEDRVLWEAFCQSQAHWSEIILKSPSWDQWVWPWACMIEQGLVLCLEGKKPSASRMGPPEGWKDRKTAAWGSLGMRAWQSAQEISGGAWEDLWIGLLVDRLLNTSPACE